MKSFLGAGLAAALVFIPSVGRSDVVYDSNQYPPGDSYWWWGYTNYQEEGNVIALAGAARSLQAVTVDDFAFTTGTFEITASIYAVPATINDGDTLSNPLWSETVQKSYQGAADWKSTTLPSRP